MKWRTLALSSFTCAAYAFAQEQSPATQQPAKRATTTFVGTGNRPIRVIEEGGATKTVDQKKMKPLNVPPGTAFVPPNEPSEKKTDEAAPQEGAAAPTENAPAAPPKEKEQPPDEKLLKQLIQDELQAASTPVLKGNSRATAKTRELTPKEEAILNQVRADMQKANTPQMKGAQDKSATASAPLSPADQALRDKLEKELYTNATPQLPESAQKRDKRIEKDRVNKGENPSGINAPPPQHLMALPSPQLPDKDRHKNTYKPKKQP